MITELQQEKPVIGVRGLTRTYGDLKALDGVSLTIPQGVVFGLVGKNGAGKTTLIRHVMGLLQAQSGSVSVFGLDPVSHPVEVLSRIGYMGETDDLPGWMRVKELVNYRKAFFPAWDDSYAGEIMTSFEIDPGKKMRDMSKGQKARVALLIALAHKPDLLVLDEPSDGLDPLLRRDILRAVIRGVVEEGRTVMFSSHLLDEVERISDHVAMIERGKIIYESDIDTLQRSFHRVDIAFSSPLKTPPSLDNCRHWEGQHEFWSAIFLGDPDELANHLAPHGGTVQRARHLNLTDAFISLVSDDGNSRENEMEKIA